MIDSVKQTYRNLRDLYRDVIEFVTMLDKDVTSEGLMEYVDAAYALKRMEDLCDEMRKSLKKKRETYERVACAAWAQKGDGEPLRTEYVTATPDIRHFVTYPRKPGDPGYKEMLNHMGVTDEEVIARGIVRPDFNSCKAYVTELVQQGEPVPPWSKSETPHTMYGLRFHSKRKEIDS